MYIPVHVLVGALYLTGVVAGTFWSWTLIRYSTIHNHPHIPVVFYALRIVLWPFFLVLFLIGVINMAAVVLLYYIFGFME
jgi:hypothetical protein